MSVANSSSAAAAAACSNIWRPMTMGSKIMLEAATLLLLEPLSRPAHTCGVVTAMAQRRPRR